jgi:D-glycero-alpha-D-manno-heptose-7-phosphate kinase
LKDHNQGQAFGAHLRTFVDAPLGSGLGASSALTVAIVEVFRAALDLPLGRYDIAHLAYAIERFDLKLPGGKQDQYASAFGGVNFIEFLPDDRVVVNPLRLNDAVLLDLQSAMIVCFSGQARQSQQVINEQVSAIAGHEDTAIQNFHRLKDDAFAMKMALLRGDLREAGTILDRSWLAKKGTAANVSNPLIERLLEVGHRNGAFAGKISGAGGGGFIVFLAEPESKPVLMRSLDEAGGKSDPVILTSGGVDAWRTSI